MKTIDIPTDDPLRMIWAVREQIYEETKDMTDDEWSAYVRAANNRVEKKLETLRSEQQKAVAAGKIVKKAWE